MRHPPFNRSKIAPYRVVKRYKALETFALLPIVNLTDPYLLYILDCHRAFAHHTGIGSPFLDAEQARIYTALGIDPTQAYTPRQSEVKT